MLNLGIIGGSPGNGHPYSFAAIGNGFSKTNLKDCEFELIKQYLPVSQAKHGCSEKFTVTNIFCPDVEQARRIARVSNINHISETIDAVFSNSDAVVLARDDLRFNSEVLERAIKYETPVFFDKQLSNDVSDLNMAQAVVNSGLVLGGGSPSLHCRDARRFIDEISGFQCFSGIGVSRGGFWSYAHHLFSVILGSAKLEHPRAIRCVKNGDDSEEAELLWEGGSIIKFSFSPTNSLPIYLAIRSEFGESVRWDFKDFYFNFKTMLEEFCVGVINSKTPDSWEKYQLVNAMILSGGESLSRGGRWTQIQVGEL